MKHERPTDPEHAPPSFEKDRLVYCFDVDGVICSNTWGEYEQAKPFPEAVAEIQRLHGEGHTILLYTARGTVTGSDWRELTERQMREWGVPFDALHMGKPNADVYIDDRAVNSADWASLLGARGVNPWAFRVPPSDTPAIAAEIGCNHMGDRALAFEMIRTAAEFCKVDIVKFQKRNPRELLTREQYDAPHPNSMHSFGSSYGEHREFLELPVELHAELKEYAESLGVTYASSVWDMTSAREIASLEPKLVKVPSSQNDNHAMVEYLCASYGGEIHISLGMTTRAEEERLIELVDSVGRLGDLVLYACTAGYPVSDEDTCLLEIQRLRSDYGDRVLGVGFSGHHAGIAIDMAAIAIGARWIERHFTLDRTMKGTDHAASLEPDGLRRLKRDSVAVTKALTFKPDALMPVESEQRRKLRREQPEEASVQAS